MNEPRRLHRSANDRWIAGVAAGVADYLNVDPTLVRILWLISIPLTSFISAVAYLIMVVVVPLEGTDWQQPSPWQPGGAPPSGSGFVPGTTPPAATETPPSGAAAPSAEPAPSTGPSYAWDPRWQGSADRPHEGGHGNVAGIAFGVLLIVMGGLFAWHELDPRINLGLTWPLAVVVVGIVLVVSSVGVRRDQ